MAELNFVEYNVNPDTDNIHDCEIAIRGLGFKKLSDTRCKSASMWAIGKCIMLLNTRVDTDTGLSGIGFNSDNCLDGSVKCQITGLNFCKFNGVNIYSYPIEIFRKNYDEYFDNSESEIPGTLPLDYIVGLTLDSTSLNNMNEFIEKLKFKIVKKSEFYITSSDKNNRFNILWNNNSNETRIKKIVLSTSDIFGVLADYATMGFDLTSTNNNDDVENFYSDIDNADGTIPAKQKIKAYGLNIYGKQKSFVIEKQIKRPLPNLDIIISQRVNHNGVNEDSILTYEDTHTKQHIS